MTQHPHCPHYGISGSQTGNFPFAWTVRVDRVTHVNGVTRTVVIGEWEGWGITRKRGEREYDKAFVLATLLVDTSEKEDES